LRATPRSGSAMIAYFTRNETRRWGFGKAGLG